MAFAVLAQTQQEDRLGWLRARAARSAWPVVVRAWHKSRTVLTGKAYVRSALAREKQALLAAFALCRKCRLCLSA